MFQIKWLYVIFQINDIIKMNYNKYNKYNKYKNYNMTTITCVGSDGEEMELNRDMLCTFEIDNVINRQITKDRKSVFDESLTIVHLTVPLNVESPIKLIVENEKIENLDDLLLIGVFKFLSSHIWFMSTKIGHEEINIVKSINPDIVFKGYWMPFINKLNSLQGYNNISVMDKTQERWFNFQIISLPKKVNDYIELLIEKFPLTNQYGKKPKFNPEIVKNNILFILSYIIKLYYL